VMSIVKSALAAGSGQVVLVYANRDDQSVIFAAELASLTARYPSRLTVIHWLESLQGLPSTETLTTLAKPYAGFEAFICGPAPFMTAVRAALTGLGVERGRVHIERFKSLGANPFEQAVAATPTSARVASVTVSLDGATSRYDWPADTKLLDLLLANGLDAPYSCREGACSACACRLVAGEVKMLNNDVLDEEDLADGIRLACQSLPVTDEVEISYE